MDLPSRLFNTDIKILQLIRRNGEFKFHTNINSGWDDQDWNWKRAALNRLLVLELISTSHFENGFTYYVAAGQ